MSEGRDKQTESERLERAAELESDRVGRAAAVESARRDRASAVKTHAEEEGSRLLARVALLVALTLIVIAAIQFVDDVGDTAAGRNGCERQNDRTRVLYDFLRDAQRARADLAATDPVGSVARKINLRAAADYRDGADDLVAAVPPPLRVAEGEPETNCDAAYPFPWPISGFD